MKISEIIGHSEKIEKMMKAYESGRLAHAYIFHGPNGIGKRSAALAFIKYVFCEDSAYKEAHRDPCSACASCRKVESSNHADLITIEPENSFIKIGMVRELTKKLRFGKYDALYRFVIIDDAECMNIESANALLKTLEEPAKDVVIILVTSKVKMLIPTIISRCQKVRFNPIAEENIKSALKARHGLSDEEAEVIAMFMQGSFSKIETSDISEMIELRHDLVRKIKDISLNNFSGIIGFSSDIGREDKTLLVETIELIKTFYRDAVIIRNGVDERLINIDIKREIEKIAFSMTLDELFEKINIMNHMQGLLMANVNKKLLIESMLIELCA